MIAAVMLSADLILSGGLTPIFAEDAPGEALQEAFAQHDALADGLTVFNGKAEQKIRSGWYSNLTPDEEQEVLDSMNGNFKDAVLKKAREKLEDPDPWDYESMLLAVLYEQKVVPEDKLDAYLLARFLYADNLASKLREEFDPVIERFLEENPDLAPQTEEFALYEDGFELDDGGVFLAAEPAMAAAAPEVSATLEGMALTEDTIDTGDVDIPDTWESFNTAEYNEIRENPFKATAVSPLSTFSIDVDTAGYTKVKYDILDGCEIEKDEVKTEELINYFNFDYSADRTGDEPFLVSAEYTVCPWNAEHELLRIGIKADDLQEKPDTNFVLVTDVSGSMMLINKLPLALSAYADMLENFDGSDTISLIYYASGNGIVLENISCSEKEKIYEGLAEVLVNAGGGTNGALGLNTAYELAEESFIEGGVNRVIIATDGDFNIGQTSQGQLKGIVEEGRRKGVYLTILGYGSENLKDNKMEVMAENGNGNYHYIGDMKDAQKALVQESSCTLIPVADDVKIQVEFNPARVQEYRLIGYESRLLNAEDFNNDKVDAGEVGAGKSVTALYEIVPAGAEAETNTPELKYSRQETEGSSEEICTVAIRYKETNSGKTGSASSLIEKPVLASEFREIPGRNTALAISLAEFGMVLRDSEYKGTASLSSAEAIAQAVAEETGSELVQSYADLIGTLKEQSR